MKYKLYISFCIILFLSVSCFCFGKCVKAKDEAINIDDLTAKKILEHGIGEQYSNAASVQENTLYHVIGRGIEIVLGIVGVVLILLMIYAGYLWFGAGGNEEQIAKAKSYIKNAIIGIIIVLSAYAITYFVMTKLTGIM